MLLPPPVPLRPRGDRADRGAGPGGRPAVDRVHRRLPGGGAALPASSRRADLLRFRPVSPLTRLRLGLAALWLRRVTDWRRYQGRGAADWIRSRVGRRGYEAVWGPLLRAKFGDRAEDVSLVWFWGKIHLRFASRPKAGRWRASGWATCAAPSGGWWTRWWQAVRDRGGRLESGRSVERVVVEGGRAVGVALRDGALPDGERERIERCDAVIATVPSGAFRRLTPGLERRYGAMLEAVRYQWATVLLLALDRPLSETYWLTMSDDDCPFVVAVEQTNFVPASRVRRAAPGLLLELLRARRPGGGGRRRADARALPAVHPPHQPALRALLGARALALQGPRRPAGRARPLSRDHPAAPHPREPRSIWRTPPRSTRRTAARTTPSAWAVAWRGWRSPTPRAAGARTRPLERPSAVPPIMAPCGRRPALATSRQRPRPEAETSPLSPCRRDPAVENVKAPRCPWRPKRRPRCGR